MGFWTRDHFFRPRCWTVIVLLSLTSVSQAQVHGTRASVTSLGGQFTVFNPPGVRPSVTSLGPRGFTPGFQSPQCCFRIDGGHRNHGGSRGGRFAFGVLPLYSMPYYYGYPEVEQPVDDTMEQQYGPVAERSAQNTAQEQQNEDRIRHLEQQLDEIEAKSDRGKSNPSQSEPHAQVADQPSTLLVFQDGHTLEVRNYAIVGDQLYDLSEGARRRIALADLDVSATEKQNDSRGLEFRLPTRPLGN